MPQDTIYWATTNGYEFILSKGEQYWRKIGDFEWKKGEPTQQRMVFKN